MRGSFPRNVEMAAGCPKDPDGYADMAFTATEKAKIRLYLGMADQFRDQNTRLESILENDLSPEAEVLVQSALASLELIEAKMISVPLENLGLKRVDEVWFKDNVAGTLGELKMIARPYIARISIILGVPVYGDAFGSQGWPGDSFSELGGMASRGRRGGFIPLG